MAAHTSTNGPPNFSRRCAVINTIGPRSARRNLRRALPRAPTVDAPRDEKQGVDPRVSRHEDAVGRYVLAKKIIARARPSARRDRRRAAPSATVGLLGPWRRKIARSQTRLDVANRNSVIEGGQRGAEHSGGIALDEHQIGRAHG